MVTRMKGLENWSELSLKRVFDLQIRNGAAGTRDELRLSYSGNKIELDRSNAEINANIDLTEWHIYRIVVDGNNYIYIMRWLLRGRKFSTRNEAH